MKTIPAPLQAMFASETLTIAALIQITLIDGTVYRLTDHDVDVVSEGQTFKASLSLETSSVKTGIGGEVSSFEFSLLMTDDGVTRDGVDAGVFDGAAVVYYVTDWKVPTNGRITWFAGEVTRVRDSDGMHAEFEVTPLLANDRTLAEDKWSQMCRVDFGGPECGVDIEALKAECTVQSAVNQQQFVVDDASEDDHWAHGFVLFTSGANAGNSLEIGKSLADGTITLKLVTPYPIEPGDEVSLYPGCSHLVEDCKLYQNIVNFRGEPFGVTGDVFDSTTPPNTSIFSGTVYSTSG